ncbi:uncharacterized protein LOC144720177 [Lampetra planeri]
MKATNGARGSGRSRHTCCTWSHGARAGTPGGAGGAGGAAAGWGLELLVRCEARASDVTALVGALRRVAEHVRTGREDKGPWFPRRLQDLDRCRPPGDQVRARAGPRPPGIHGPRVQTAAPRNSGHRLRLQDRGAHSAGSLHAGGSSHVRWVTGSRVRQRIHHHHHPAE